MNAVFADTFYWAALTAIDDPAYNRALDIYSLTDCISMQTMHRHGLTEVLTNDRHFEQEGFRALFR